jgi:hypothetical protein
VGVDGVTSPEPLRELDKLFTRVDARIASIIEQGVSEHLYFLSVKVLRIVDGADHHVNPVRERYVPICVSHQDRRVRNRALPTAPYDARAPAAPAGAQESRQELREPIDHQPERRQGRTP